MRIVVKGGVWKNTEDEILKAAVMKYGKNQWARISSLLTRKTPKQCKARWYEWIDPSIKKTEWAKEEDEKLLHLAKLMPTQWRTIAPIVGRTPAQCLERYQKLLDEAEQDTSGGMASGDKGPTADDVRRLRPGEIDPDPEAKPARPDPVDMDEDEKEMLSEARARLANTQGKKAKRKARERQLEESRRLAALQKRRELKAAGIYVGAPKRHKGEMDYNVDIPFQRAPLAGFFDTTQELGKRANTDSFENKLLSKLDGKRKAEIEQIERRKDMKKRKTQEEQGISFIRGSENPDQIFEEPERVARRSQLNLPAPQVSDAELDEIIKLGFAGEVTRSMVEASGNDGTTTLLSDYTAMTTGLPMRTPRTSSTTDTVRQEARNLLVMNNLQTPLLGEENTPIHLAGGTGFDGATPRRTVLQTPNSMLVQMTPRGGAVVAGSATPRSLTSSGTPMRTPYRDEMGINTPMREFEETPHNEQQRTQAQRLSLAQALSSLPKPKNDFQIVVPDTSATNADQDDITAAITATQENGTTNQVADMSDIENNKLSRIRAQEDEKRTKQSQAVQRQLPRPFILPPTSAITIGSPYTNNPTLSEAENLVLMEMIELLKNDMHDHPQPGVPAAAPPSSIMEDFSLSQLSNANELIKDEFNAIVDKIGGLPDLLKIYNNDDDENTREAAQAVLRDFVEREEGWLLDPKQGKYVHMTDDTLTNEQKISVYRNAYEAHRAWMVKESRRAVKLENKLNVVLGGYQSRSIALRKQLATAYVTLQSATEELDVFSFLQQTEQQSIPLRIEQLSQQVEDAKRQQAHLQNRYVDLTTARDGLQSSSSSSSVPRCMSHSPLSQQNPQVLPTGTLVDGSSHDYHSTTGYNASTSPNGDYSANNQTQGSRSGHMVSTGTLGTHVPSSHSVLSQIQPHTSPPQQQPLQSRPPMEFEHAISYIDKVKNRYANEPDIYRQFLDILQTYQREQRSIQEVYTQMIQLFQSAPDLLDEFKHFMPETASLSLLSLSPQLGPHTSPPQHQPLQSIPPMVLDHATSYVDKVKNRYANEPDIYRQFLDILQTYQREQRPIHEMYTQMIQLFQSAPDLLDEFKHFMPETASLPLLSLSPQLGHTALPSENNAH